MIVENKFGKIAVLNDREFFKNKYIGLSMSGGTDSTMLCYLMAKSIYEKDLNTVIQPYNGYDISLPHDSLKLPKIIEYIQNKFSSVDLRWPISTVFDSKGKDIKNFYLRPLRDSLYEKGFFDFLMVGVNLGPPEVVQKNFPSVKRLPGYMLENQLTASPKNAPFVNVDKRFIIQCYKDFDMLDILSQTSSCLISDPPCKNCWWCYERKWAIEEVLK